MILPFEHDSLALLEVCAEALVPLPSVPNTQEASSLAQTGILPPAQTVRQRFSDDHALMKQTESLTGGEYRRMPLMPTMEKETGFSVEALSRAVERDARRFDANA